MIVLWKLVFQPYLRVKNTRRPHHEDGGKAEETNANQALAAEFETKLQAAKQEALELKVALRAEGVQSRMTSLARQLSKPTTNCPQRAKSSPENRCTDRVAGTCRRLASVVVSKVLGRAGERRPFNLCDRSFRRGYNHEESWSYDSGFIQRISSSSRW